MKLYILPFMLIASLFSGSLMAVEEKLTQRAEMALIQAFGPQIQVDQVAKIANAQVLEVILTDGSIIHMTPDLNFVMIRDEVYSLNRPEPKNLTQARANPRRKQQLEALKAKDTIVFPAKGKKKTHIYVFTDVDCGYCQKLHSEIKEINEKGIEVRYLAYPRAGIKNPQTGAYTDSYKKLHAAWCSKTPKQAMTEMKTLQQQLNRASMPLRQGSASATQKARYQELDNKMSALISKNTKCDAPIEKEFLLGQKLGVRGTPAIVSEDGELYPGYLPAVQLAKRLGIK